MDTLQNVYISKKKKKRGPLKRLFNGGYTTIQNIKKAFCVLAGLYRSAELGNAIPVLHFQQVTMAWTGCSLAVMAMAFLCPLPLIGIESSEYFH